MGRRPPRPLPARFLFAAFLAAIASNGPASAQDDDELEPDAPVVAVQQNGFVFGEENFNQWVFNGVGDAASVRNRFESLLTLKLDALDRACGLTEPQRKKLELAGRGDIKRFFDRVEEKRRKFLATKRDQNNINEIFQEIQPLQLALQGEQFGEGSFFTKAVPKTLDDGQAAKFEAAAREATRFRYRAKIDLALAMLDNAVGLNAEQREKLTKLLAEETTPPKRFGQYDYYYVWYEAAKLPEAKLRPIFDDAQWTVVGRQIQQAKGMEHFLRQNGFLGPVTKVAGPTRVARPAAGNR